MRLVKRHNPQHRSPRQPRRMPARSTACSGCSALYGIFEYADGAVAHTAASRMLRQDHPQSMRSLVRMFGLPGFWTAVGELGSAIRTGEPSANRALPGGIWGYLTENPEASRIFGEAMTAKAHGHIAGIVQVYDFSGLNVIADIGGGRGHLIQAIVSATPTAAGVLFDQPHVVKEAAAVASDRLHVIGGDFFNDQKRTGFVRELEM